MYEFDDEGADDIFKAINDMVGTNCDRAVGIARYVEEEFFLQPDYDGAEHQARPDSTTDGYLNDDKSLGALIIKSARGDIKVCVLADFKNEQQVIMVIEPDGPGHGDMLQISKLSDVKLYKLRPDIYEFAKTKRRLDI